jgi:hypothetical protein
VKICNAPVDGFDKKTGIIYQYHGCFWHGCPKCFSEDTVNNVNREEMGDLFEQTKERTEQLKQAGYNVVEMWECQWKKSSLYKRWKNMVNDVIEPLNPRDAYFGGRTEVFKLKGCSNEENKIKYIDVCSLYPTVMFFDKYPIGHPIKIFEPRYYDKDWFGLIKCKIVAPRNLYIPTLPVKIRMDKAEKLVFPLCLQCSQNRSQKCKHTVEERALVGTWTTEEVNVAISKGYHILDVYEVWDFKASTDIFKTYINKFMKIKLESSPHSYKSAQAYADDVKMRQGFDLDITKIKQNQVKRQLAKLAMNSLYGKFGQRNNMSQTEFVTQPSRFYELLLNNKLTDIHVTYLTEDMIQVNYRYKDVFVDNKFNTNIFIALYTTANARLRLYDQLAKLGKAVLYCDTDSIVYYDNGVNSVTTGDLLGEWTDELDGKHIEKWLATGPKSYYYKTNKGKECTKCKGFTLNHKNAEKINAETMEKLIDGEIENIRVTNTQITRNVQTKQLVNKDETKTLSFNFDKRIIVDNYNTLPYGYH